MRNALCAIVAIALGCGAASAAEPIINTIAGGGVQGTNGSVGDGGNAKLAYIYEPTDVALDASGNLYIAEACRIRKVTPAGVITTFGGNGYSESRTPRDGEQATSYSICTKTVAVDRFGYVWYSLGPTVYKIAPNGVVTTVVGNIMESGYAGDGGHVSNARIIMAADITFDAAGNAYLADYGRVRKISTNNIITTVAGNGDEYGDSGDYGPATAAQLSPRALTVDKFGNLLIADQHGRSVRKVDTKGMISRVYGGWPKYRSDPVAQVNDALWPTGLATDAAGNLFVSNDYNLVSRVGTNGALQHVVGEFNDTTFGSSGGMWGFEGDGGPARVAKLRHPKGIATDAQGNLYIADTENMRVRKVTGSFGAPPPLPAGTFTLAHATPQRLESPNQYSVGTVKGDANGDGRDDLFVLTGNWWPDESYPGDWKLHVYRQNADGTMAAPLSYPFAHVQFNDVMAIDLNHDRYTDIVIAADGGVYSGLYVMLGGANGMAPPVKYNGINGYNRPFYLQQADMDGDGNMDVLALLASDNAGVSGEAIFYSNGLGQFVRKKHAPFNNAGVSAIGDFNGDGKPDMLYSHNPTDESYIVVAYHDGVDNFLPPIQYPAGGRDRAGFFPAVGDFDSDGTLDVILAVDGNAPWAKLTHWRQTPEGGFAFVRDWLVFDNPQTLVAADMNRDGRQDLLIAHQGWSAIGYMQQARKADGSYWLDVETKAYANIGNQAQPHALAVGDYNNDHCPDVAFTSTNSGLQIQYNTRESCLTEMNGAKPRTPPPTKPTQTSSGVASGTTTTVASQPTTSITSATYAAIVKRTRKGWASVSAMSEPARFALGFLSFGFAAWLGLGTARWWLRR